jgi:ABC-2 type transport system permease protein
MFWLNKFIGYLQLAAAYTRLNCKIQLEYRGAFVSQAGAMIFNDCCWVAFWSFFFTNFQVVNGWGSAEIITLWAMSAAGYGLGHALFGNSLHLSGMIARGELDAWLLYPRTLLPHIVLGRMNVSSVGDAIFGYAVYLAFARPDAPHLLMFVFLTFSIALLFVSFTVITASLSFFLGNAESLSEQWRFAMVTFSTYPAALFNGTAKVFLYTLIPAAFVSYYPIEALRKLSLADAGISLAGALAVTAVAMLVFQIGLNRYESGNAIGLRG